MAGNLRKDVELIFKGEDRASPTIKSVSKTVGELTSEIEKQLAAAERGEGSIDDLAKAYKGLKDAQGDVSELARIAAAHETLTKKLAEQNKIVEDAKAKQAALAAQVEAAEKPTKRLVNQRDAATRSVERAVAEEVRLQGAIQASSATLEAAGLDARNFANAQEQVRAAALETARALRDAAAAKETFGSAQASGKANIAASDEMAAFNSMAAGSGLPKAQIEFIATLENRLQQLQLAIREDQASMANLNRELADRAAADAAQRIRGMAAAMTEAEASAERLKAAAQFRNFAAEIEAGARNVARFGPQADTAAASAHRLGDAINGILNPANEAARTLDGVNGAIERSESVLDGSKRRMSEYNREINNLQQATAGIQDMARLVDTFRQQEGAVAGATAEFQKAQAEVLKLAQDIKTAEAPTQEMANALAKAEANLEKAGGAMQRESTKLAQLDTQLKKAGIDTKNLAHADDQLVAAANRAAAAQGKLAGKTGGKGSFLGLNPNEMQNLGYQINDIFVSLASGQKPLTVLTQQGAQIGQIIPGAFSKIIQFAPEIAAFAAVFIVMAGAMGKAADQALHLKDGLSLVAQFGSATPIDAQQFAVLGDELQKAGLEAEKCRGELMKLASDGLDAGQIEQYIQAAKGLSAVTGEDMTASLAKMREGFQGSIEDIEKLDADTHFINDTELDHIQTLFKQGRADEARAQALQIYADKAADVANKQMGPWARAASLLKEAWDRMLTSISNWRPFQEVLKYFHDVAIGAAYIAARLAGYSHEEAGKRAVGTIPVGPAQPGRGQVRVGNADRTTEHGRDTAAADALALKAATARTREQRKQVALETAHNEAQALGLSNTEERLHVESKLAQFNAAENVKQEKRDTAAGKRADAAQRKREAAARAAANRAEAEANRIQNQAESIQKGIESLDSAVGKKSETLESVQGAITSQYAKLLRDLADYSKATGGKGKIGDMTISQAEAHIQKQEQELKNYAGMAFYEKQLGELAKERQEKLGIIEDQVARGDLSPEEGLQASDAVLAEMAAKMNTLAQTALDFALALKSGPEGAMPGLDALIAKLRNSLQANSGGQNVKVSGENRMKAVTAEQSKLNTIIERRNALVQNENNLVALGLRTRRDAQNRIAGFYAETEGPIKAEIANVLKLADAFRTGTPEQQLFYKSLQAELATTGQEAGYVDGRMVELKTSINQLVASNIVGFIDQVAQAFANLATGQSSVLGFFAAIGTAFLDMIAKTLQGIAMLIIQMIILDAVDKLTGGILKPLLKLYGAVPVHHEGGVVGAVGGRSRNVDPAIFANAPRYHTGGIAGLAPDERAAILRKGEEVLTDSDPRHRNNGGMAPAGPGGAQNMRAVLAVGDDQIAESMASSAGEKVVLFHLRRNKVSVKQMLDS